MDRRTFYFIIDHIEEDEMDKALYMIRQNLPYSIERLEEYITTNKDEIDLAKYLNVFQVAVSECYPEFIVSYLSKDYVNLGTIFAHCNSFLYGTSFFKVRDSLNNFCHKVAYRIKQKAKESNSAIVNIKLLNEELTNQFILDFPHEYDVCISENIDSQTISQYSLGILYILVSELLEWPIYGLTQDNSLKLVYAMPYCTDSELVCEEDIQYYLLPGNKDLIYSLLDVKLYAFICEEAVGIKKILPNNNKVILYHWMHQLFSGDRTNRINQKLSAKYQQICELSLEFEPF